ncbi:MAG: PAS domain S-box protein [Sedimentisphaerales bacterium]|nr:PAS domain S-box protein [Sedimentisphaerales bacterium]
MEAEPIRILLVEDNQAHSRLIRRAFQSDGRPTFLAVVETLGAARKKLQKSSWDIVITDLILPDGKGTDLLSHLVEPAFPLIIMTSYGDEQVAVDAIKAGALEYVVKTPASLNAMPDIVERTLREWMNLVRRRQVEQALRESEEKFRTLAEQSPNMIFIHQKDRIVYANRCCEEVMGYRRAEIYAPAFDVQAIFDPESFTRIQNNFQRHRQETDIRPHEYTLITRDGKRLEVIITTKRIRFDGEGAILAIVTDITERKQAERKLLDYQKQLRCLTSQLCLTEEHQRRQIATALHDNIGQLLALCKIKLGALAQARSPESIHAASNEIRQYVENAINFTRSLTFELSPPILYELGLPAAIEWLVDQNAQQHDLQIRYEINEGAFTLSSDWEILLFQAVRELLMNIVKHARARQALVSLQCQDNHLHIVVQDDGVGFDPCPSGSAGWTRDGFGLFNIRERLDQLGGRMKIHSGPNAGTRVTLIAPLTTPTPAKTSTT